MGQLEDAADLGWKSRVWSHMISHMISLMKITHLMNFTH